MALLGRFPFPSPRGLADEGSPDPLDLDGARPAQAVSRTDGTGRPPPRPGLKPPQVRGREPRLALIRRSGSRGLVPLVELSRGPAAALRSAVLRFAAILDLMSRHDPSALRAFIHSIPCRLARPIVVVNATGTRIGMPSSSGASLPSPACRRHETNQIQYQSGESCGPRFSRTATASGCRARGAVLVPVVTLG
jgi:hypothetical protein